MSSIIPERCMNCGKPVTTNEIECSVDDVVYCHSCAKENEPDLSNPIVNVDLEKYMASCMLLGVLASDC